jgi:hypothetical protein
VAVLTKILKALTNVHSPAAQMCCGTLLYQREQAYRRSADVGIVGYNASDFGSVTSNHKVTNGFAAVHFRFTVCVM